MCGIVACPESEEYKGSDSQLSAHLRASLHLYSVDIGLLCYRTDVADTARVVVPHNKELKYRIRFEATILHSVSISAGKRLMAL